MRRSKGVAFGAAVVFAAAGLFLAGRAAHGEEKWKAYTYDSVITVAGGAGLVRIAEEVEKETKGELKMQVHVGGSLPIEVSNITQAVGDGIIQFAQDGFFLGTITIGGILRLPMLLSSEAEYLKAEKILEPYLTRAYEKQGCLVLGSFYYPLQVAFCNKKLTSLAEMAGKKMRVSSPEQAEFVKRFGGIPVTIGAPEVPPALERGVVDGAFTASGSGGKVWGDLFTHNYRLGPNYFNTLMIVNQKSFGRLSPSNQKKLREVTARVAPTITANLKTDDEQIIAAHKAKGIVVTEPKPAELAEAGKRMADFWDKWAKSRGPEHMEALAKVRKALGK